MDRKCEFLIGRDDALFPPHLLFPEHFGAGASGRVEEFGPQRV
jgi:hypothetical protein